MSDRLLQKIIDLEAERDALQEELEELSGTLEFNTNCWTRERAVMIDKNQTLTADLIACGLNRKSAENRISNTIAKLELAASMMDDDERGNRFAEVCRLTIGSLNEVESGADK